MRIFISHPIVDLDLAKKLKEILMSNKKIEEAYIAITKPEYQLDIPEKIIKEMNNSDYLVAIITTNTFQSASVHQEIGYAQGINLIRIPMVENGAKAGFLHESKDKIEFNRENFPEACNQALEWIITHGPTKKNYTDEEGLFIQKSAHYRKVLEYWIAYFLDSIYYRFDVGGNKDTGLVSHGDPELTKSYMTKIKKFFEKNEEELISHMSEIDFSMYGKLDSELMECKIEIERAERLPHTYLLQEESDLIVSLKERLSQMDENDLDVGHYCRQIYDPELNFDFNTCSQFVKIKGYEREIRNHLRYISYDLREITVLMIDLMEVYLKYKKKFGSLAFKNT